MEYSCTNCQAVKAALVIVELLLFSENSYSFTWPVSWPEMCFLALIFFFLIAHNSFRCLLALFMILLFLALYLAFHCEGFSPGRWPFLWGLAGAAAPDRYQLPQLVGVGTLWKLAGHLAHVKRDAEEKFMSVKSRSYVSRFYKSIF